MSEFAAPYEISEIDFGDGDLALAAAFPIPPFGESVFTSEDTTTASRQILESLAASWPGLWPAILDKLEEGIIDFQLPRKLETDEFSGLVATVDPEHPLAAKSEIYLSLEFEDEPHWDFYLKGTRIIHSEPVA